MSDDPAQYTVPPVNVENPDEPAHPTDANEPPATAEADAPAEPNVDEDGVKTHEDGSREFTEVPWPGY